MMNTPLIPPLCQSYTLRGVRYIDGKDPSVTLKADVVVENGIITTITDYSSNNKVEQNSNESHISINVSDYFLTPTFADIHTHLDKTHTDIRAENLTQSHGGAVQATLLDRVHFTPTDLYRRMDFALDCAFHHGTSMIRSHINSSSDLHITDMAWRVFNAMKQKWLDKITLQGVIFVLPSCEFGMNGKATEIATIAAKHGGSVLGSSFSSPPTMTVAAVEEDDESKVDYQGGSTTAITTTTTSTTTSTTIELGALFALAKKLGEFHLDVHVDEHGDGSSDSLLTLARLTIQNAYQGRVTASHCCSLSLASPEHFQSTLRCLQEAQISVVSLPACNLYLQDRVPNVTPRWRGVAPVHELRTAGIPICFASDNVRDAFFPYGDMDMLDTFNQSCRITQIGPQEASKWFNSVTSIPAAIISRSEKGAAELGGIERGEGGLGAWSVAIEVGGRANFVLFKAQSLHEIMCRPNTPRWVVRNGAVVTTPLPPYSDLYDVNTRYTPLSTSTSTSTSTSNKLISAENEFSLPEVLLESTLQRVKMDIVDTAIPIIDISALVQQRARSAGGAHADTLVEEKVRVNNVHQEIWKAATEVGFFQISNHGISKEEILDAFEQAERFFSLPLPTKNRLALKRELNSGFEYYQQVRPSTNLPDQKESYQITSCNMDKGDLWPPSESLPAFRTTLESFAQKTHSIALILLASLAVSLGLPVDYFDSLHDATASDCQSTLRLLHYPAVDQSCYEEEGKYFRAGPHTDWDCLTLLYQRTGENGLEVSSHALAWNPVEPIEGLITVNIGDMLMRWSDNKLKSTLHRVQFPSRSNGVSFAERYSMAYFMQANKSAIIQGIEGIYPPISAGDYILMRIKSNYSK